jgi:hypothetical protein
LSRPSLPAVDRWISLRVPYFGTIGKSVYETQTMENRKAIAADADFSKVISESARTGTLCLGFQQSTARENRDLDNLADALMPLFNQCCSRLDRICLIKPAPAHIGDEVLYIASDSEW